MKSLLFHLLLCLALPSFALAQVDVSKTLTQNRINLASLKINKTQFFNLVDQEIKARPLGVDSYGQAFIQLCNYKTEKGHLHDLRNEEGRDIKNLSNPSCDQIILSKVLQESYGYIPDNISNYRNRQCLLDLSKMIQPLLSYYTLKIEEPAKGCNYCESRQQATARMIQKFQGKVNQNCGKEAGKIGRFVQDFSQEAEKSMNQKVEALKK